MKNQKKNYTEKDRSSLIKVLTKSLGMDLSSIPMPVIFNEPITLLQKLVELSTYHDLLTKANKCNDPQIRLLYVTAFCLSTYAFTDRMSKPFNPLLGETFEFREKGVKYVCEQVSHHPPIAAMVMESDDFQVHQHVSVNTKFKVNNLDLQFIGYTTIQLKGHEDEYYQYDAPKAVVHNIIVGRLWIDHVGDISVKVIGSERRSDLHYKQCGWFNKGYREVQGSVLNDKGKEIFKLYSKWNDRIIATRVAKSKIKVDDDYLFEMDQDYIIWKHEYEVDQGDFKKWKFPERSAKLCKINNSIIAKMPKSDSRFRTDRLLLQNKEVKKAGKEKHKLEEGQRQKKKYREKNGLEFVPKYFEISTINDIEFWQYNGVYDKERKVRLKNYKKNKESDIEYIVEFAVDEIDFEENNQEENSSHNSENIEPVDDVALPEAEEVPEDV